jgi:hypothetical protein
VAVAALSFYGPKLKLKFKNVFLQKKGMPVPSFSFMAENKTKNSISEQPYLKIPLPIDI